MGVINRMLEDLEERGAVERGVLPPDIRSAPHVAKFHTARSLGVVGLILILALVWHFGSQTRETPPPGRLAELSPPPPAVAPPESHAPAADVPIEATPISSTRVEPAAGADDESKQSARSEASGTRRLAASEEALKPPAPVIAAKTAPRASVRLEAKADSSSDARTEALSREAKVMAAGSEEPQPQPVATPAEKIPDTPDISPTPRTPAAQIAGTGAEVSAQPALARPQMDRPSRQTASRELAESEYRGAMNLLSSGRPAEAHERFRLALQHYPAHVGARQALYAQLLEAKKTGEAEQVLYDALKVNPDQPGFAMALARLQLDRGDGASAIETLQRSAPAAQGSPDYMGVLASLLQRQARHQEAIEHYQAALRLAPQSGIWLMGLGVSLQAIRRPNEAQDAYRRAKATNSLNPQLQAFVDERLKQLR